MTHQATTLALPAAARLLLAASLALATGATLAQGAATLSAPAERISDRAISTDQQTYEALQARLKAINAGGRPLRDYHLAKAQCWLDVSFHEYSRNDRGPFPQDALAQADQLASGMQGGQPPLGWATPLVSGAERLRPDLWARAEALRDHTGWRCAQAKAACAEVELVHAGHEQAQLQWRHAKPYVQIAEDLVAEAQVLAERCDPPAPPPVARVAPPPPPVVLPPPPVPLQLGASVVFSFDRHGEADMRPFSVAQLEALVAQVKADGLVLQRVQLAGHADRLNGTGHDDYNQRLSEKRVATVRAALARLGLPGLDTVPVSTAAFGDGRQVQACSGRFGSTAELQECLLPNRRVEVLVTALPARR
jgi:outer membrane protein OmpA-like peptidoglycan-associated protein